MRRSGPSLVSLEDDGRYRSGGRPGGSKTPCVPNLPQTTSSGSLVSATAKKSMMSLEDSRHGGAEDEIEELNMRAMGDKALRRQGKCMLLPSSYPLDLLFFRSVFDHMLDEAYPPGVERPKNDGVPTTIFQRSMERLFFLLEDPQGFSSDRYDVDDNGYIGWSEFVHVCLQRDVIIRLSFLQRVFLTLDRPESSYLAHIISVGILCVIALSSLCFILSTMPEFQYKPSGTEAPKPYNVFAIIEQWCLTIFVVEYLARLLTCWTSRPEVHDLHLLLARATGFEELELESPLRLVISFILSPPNLIDLFAILPGVGSMAVEGSGGGGFVVLRLVRLTRILRAPQIREPTTIIYLTIQRSTKALYVLAFNMGLGMVIFGSLMFLAEKGEWDWVSGNYLRFEGRDWNNATRRWEDVKGESPFRSIPHTFWWAIVTSTTVGYGDQFPTTSYGYLCAVALMLFSLVIAALPVGVIGNNFSIVWEELALQKQEERQRLRLDTAVVKASMQRCAPFDWMSRLMVIDVWNERFPSKYRARTAWTRATKPQRGEFLGMARVRLELPRHVAVTQELTLPLEPDFDTVHRKVSGSIHFRYEWWPAPGQEPIQPGPSTKDDFPELRGTLRVTILDASDLTNVNNSSRESKSNPFCIVFCYPKAPPVSGGLVYPDIWSTSVVINDLSPRWDASHDFEFSWVPKAVAATAEITRFDAKYRRVPVTVDGEEYNLYERHELHAVGAEQPQQELALPGAAQTSGTDQCG